MTESLLETATPAADAPADLLHLDHVSKAFRVPRSSRPFAARTPLLAVDDVSLTVPAGQTVGIVGESGSGKSTLGRVALRLLDPTSGRIVFDGRDVTGLRGGALRRLRSEMQVVFQDPLASLNPRMTAAATIGEPLRVFRGLSGRELDDRVASLLDAVGLRRDQGGAHPRHLSGGQRQRVGIARAIAVSPRLILADEAVSALDVSVQAQVINLMAELRERLGLTYLFIAHGLPVVRQLSHVVCVMYLGRIVEQGPVDEVFSSPAHPYTRALFAAAPSTDPRRRGQHSVLAGEPPSLLSKPSGCRFRTRCPMAADICAELDPPDVDLGGGRTAACHFAESLAS